MTGCTQSAVVNVVGVNTTLFGRRVNAEMASTHRDWACVRCIYRAVRLSLLVCLSVCLSVLVVVCFAC